MKKNNEKKLNILIHDLGSVNFGIIRKFQESKLLNNIYVITNKQHRLYISG